MRKLFSIIYFCLLVATSLEAGDGGVELTRRGKELTETEPKRTITAVYLVTNKTSEKRAFTSEVKLPQGWRVITRDFPFELDSGESDVRLVSFFIPQATLAGKYEVNYSVKEREPPSISFFDTLYVVVLPVTKLKAKLLDAPEYVIAGEDYRASFVVMNASNIENTVTIKIDSREGLPFIVDAEKFKLAPGESKTVTVSVKTDLEMRKALKHCLQLTTQVLEDEKVKAQAMSFVEIIPRITGVEERFHRIPVWISLTQATQKNQEYKSGFQTKISGAGTLDEEGKRHVNFFYRGLDIHDKSIFHQHDQYRFSFWTKNYALHIGDQTYSLSPLTENRYGRGLRAKLNLRNFSFGAYYQKTRWIQPEERRIAGRIDYLISQKHKIGINYLNKKTEDVNDEIGSLHGQLKVIGNTEVELEYAYGKENKEFDGEDGAAYLVGVRGSHNWISYSVRFIHAGPDYPGYYGDVDFFTVRLATPLGSKLRLNAGFHQGKSNLDLDTTLYSAALEKHYQLGLNYRFGTGTNLSFEYRNPIREDRLLDPDFDYEEKSYRLAVSHGFKKLNLRSTLEFGKSRDNLTGQTSKLQRHTLYTYFRRSSRQTYSGYIQYYNDVNFTGKKRRHITAALESAFKIGNRTYLNLNFRTYDYQEPDQGDRNDFEIRLIHSFPNKNRISVYGRYSSYRNSKGGDFGALMVEYTLPFGLPVSRKKSLGMVKGYIYDEETRAAMSDVILRLNGATAVSDKRGKFSFPSLKPGTYHLDINTARFGMNRIPAQKTPIEVTIREGKETFIKIGITQSAALSGQIMLYRLEKKGNGHLLGENSGNNHSPYSVVGEGNNNHISSSDDEAKLVKAYGLPDIIVELTNGSEIKRRATDNKGCFTFEELRPGRWTLKVYDQGLPEYHYLEKDRFELEFKPGEKEEILIKVLPKKRRIRIIQEGGIILEEEKK